VKGQVVRSDWNIKVTNPHLLYAAHPHCVDLKPRTSEIKELLRSGIKPPGVEATPVTKAGVRAGKPQPAIDV